MIPGTKEEFREKIKRVAKHLRNMGILVDPLLETPRRKTRTKFEYIPVSLEDIVEAPEEELKQIENEDNPPTQNKEHQSN